LDPGVSGNEPNPGSRPMNVRDAVAVRAGGVGDERRREWERVVGNPALR
jgi:hypothetical protein